MIKGINGAKIWKFGDNINTDLIHPPHCFSLDKEKIKEGLMKGLHDDFSQRLTGNDVIVAGENFGCGSSREVSAKAIKYNGIRIIIAKSFARIFFRNLTNNGVILIEHDLIDHINEADLLNTDFDKGVFRANGKEFPFKGLGGVQKEIIEAGGLLNKLKEDFHERV